MADTTTTTYGLVKPEVGASADTWGGKINADLDALDDLLDGTTAIQPRITGGSIAGITDLAIADGGTGASTAANARTNLGLGTIATQASNSVAITGGSITGITDLAIADGGTGASTAANARTNLGLGTIATQASSAVSITGGSITGITDLAVADGGTGSSTAAGALTNLGLTATAAELNTLDNINTAGNFGLVPSGAILLWSGAAAAIPAGWRLCDGTNGTPNLRDRFVVGAGSTYAVGATGGAATVTLTTAQLPSHTHPVNINSGTQSANHTHGFQPLAVLGSGGTLDGRAMSGGPPQIGAQTWDALPASNTGNESATHFHNVNGNTNAAGSGTAHENLPPYYALCYIMKS